MQIHQWSAMWGAAQQSDAWQKPQHLVPAFFEAATSDTRLLRNRLLSREVAYLMISSHNFKNFICVLNDSQNSENLTFFYIP